MSIRSNVDRAALNERITLQRLTHTQSTTTGDTTPVWTALVTCWARADGVKASDRWKEPHVAGAAQAVTDQTFWIRADIVNRFALVETDRVLWKGNYYEIKDIADQQLRGRLTPLICRKGLNNG